MIDLEDIALGKMSDREIQILYAFNFYMKSKKQNKWTNITKQKQTQKYREQTLGYFRGKGGCRGEIGEGD